MIQICILLAETMMVIKRTKFIQFRSNFLYHNTFIFFCVLKFLSNELRQLRSQFNVYRCSIKRLVLKKRGGKKEKSIRNRDGVEGAEQIKLNSLHSCWSCRCWQRTHSIFWQLWRQQVEILYPCLHCESSCSGPETCPGGVSGCALSSTQEHFTLRMWRNSSTALTISTSVTFNPST